MVPWQDHSGTEPGIQGRVYLGHIVTRGHEHTRKVRLDPPMVRVPHHIQADGAYSFDRLGKVGLWQCTRVPDSTEPCPLGATLGSQKGIA